MNEVELTSILRKIISKDISVDPENWKPENPFWGTCVPVSLLAQDIFGGDLMRGDLDKTIYTAGSHYWNRLPGGEEHDFSEEQFQGAKPGLIGEVRERDYLLSILHVSQRYLLLKTLFDGFIADFGNISS